MDNGKITFCFLLAQMLNFLWKGIFCQPIWLRGYLFQTGLYFPPQLCIRHGLLPSISGICPQLAHNLLGTEPALGCIVGIGCFPIDVANQGKPGIGRTYLRELAPLIFLQLVNQLGQII